MSAGNKSVSSYSVVRVRLVGFTQDLSVHSPKDTQIGCNMITEKVGGGYFTRACMYAGTVSAVFPYTHLVICI